MKVVMLMFDSLNRRMLSPYGCEWVQTPNFQRLAERTVTFDRSYVCSMPCMPARRDLHTGRPNFLHRSWGPIEPFDDSVPEMLKCAGVHTHLATDHYHYFEEGGCTYHTRYTTWECFRGQEGDPWTPQVAPEPPEANAGGRNAAMDFRHQQDRKNRKRIQCEASMPQSQTIRAGLEFIERNAREDNWFLQIETFDPHEPFFSLQEHQALYSEHFRKYQGRWIDWPRYGSVTETPEEVEHIRYCYASLVSLCDKKLGEVLDAMDRHGLWEDTMLIVWTDHGFMLGEHDCWAKNWMPFYQEVANTPFFVWDPRSRKAGERRQALVQPSIDLGPTLLEFFGLKPTPDMNGKVLRETIDHDANVRDYALFGMFGGHVNITDGRYKYLLGPAREDNQPLYEHTLMPTHMNHTFSVEELQEGIELVDPLPFTKGCQVMKIPARRDDPKAPKPERDRKTYLFDLLNDPAEERPLQRQENDVEQRMRTALVEEMRRVHAPTEQYLRLGLDEVEPSWDHRA